MVTRKLLVIVHVLIGPYQEFLLWYIYSRVTINPQSDGICAQRSLLSILVIVHVLKDHYKAT